MENAFILMIIYSFFPNAYNGYDNLNQPLEINKTLFNVLKKCKFNTNVDNKFFDILYKMNNI